MQRNLQNETRPDGGFGIYVHWPFCKAKCPYCDFNSHVRHTAVDQKEFAKALVTELKYQHQFSSHFEVESIFFGGGTPSLMHGETVSYILENIHQLWRVSENLEISLEANPTSVEAENFRDYSSVGVNRISLGIQSLNDADLTFLGRQHSSTEALKALNIARHEFKRVSADMIYTRPGQTPDTWSEELSILLDHDLDHLSLYQLTIEPDTPFEKLYEAGKIRLPEESPARELYEQNKAICDSAGLTRYEVSNHAKEGAECRHNLIYWRYGFYAGVGPGAHGRLMDDMGRFSVIGIKHPETWLAQIHELGHGIAEKEALNPAQAGDEFLLMGLRLAEGVSLERYQAISGLKTDEDQLDTLSKAGLVSYDKKTQHLKVSDKGLPVLNKIIQEISPVK